jgi:hypothetical protein
LRNQHDVDVVEALCKQRESAQNLVKLDILAPAIPLQKKKTPSIERKRVQNHACVLPFLLACCLTALLVNNILIVSGPRIKE